MPKLRDDSITPIDRPAKRWQTQDERDHDGIAAKRAREAAPVVPIAPTKPPRDDDYTGQHEIGAIDEAELEELRESRPPGVRFRRMEVRLDNLTRVVGRMEGKLDIVLGDRKRGQRLRDNIVLRMIGGLIALVVALVLGYAASKGIKQP